MMCCFSPLVPPSGPLYWEPAEFSSQQTVGCSGGLPACFCQHANEALAGIINLKNFFFWDKCMIWLKKILLQ